MTSTSTQTDDAGVDRLERAHRSRLSGLDPLIRVPTPDPSSASLVHVAERSGQPVAMALHRVESVDPNSADAAWVPETYHSILLRADRPPGSAAAEILGSVCDFLTELGATDPVRIDVASVDLGWSRALLEHHFTPVSIIAARRSRPRDSSRLSHLPFVRIRTAVPDDLDRILPLAAAVQRFDAATGAIPEHPNPAALLQADLERDLSAHPGWTFVAERAGALVGLCALTPPPSSDWSTDRVIGDRVGYLSLLYVEPSLRVTNVGSTLVQRAHHRAAEDGLPITLLHHNPLNPLATPFWGRHGYRPLHTVWQRQPGP